MTAQTNRQFLLAKRPVGAATRDTFTYQEVPVGNLADGQVLVRNEYLSLDPAMRGWMNEGKSYIPPVGIGEVMRALGVGKVIASNTPKFAVGDYVNGALGVQDYFLGEPRGFYKLAGEVGDALVAGGEFAAGGGDLFARGFELAGSVGGTARGLGDAGLEGGDEAGGLGRLGDGIGELAAGDEALGLELVLSA
eukprot:gene1084-1440_t